MKILLATDGSEQSKAAVKNVAERPFPLREWLDASFSARSQAVALHAKCSVEIVRSAKTQTNESK